MWFKKKMVGVATKSNYVVVIHSWFVESKGFQKYILKDKTYDEAVSFAKEKSFDLTSTFNKTAYTIVEWRDE